jgi:hypothetical protein
MGLSSVHSALTMEVEYMLVVFIRALLLIATIASCIIFTLLLVVYGDLKEDDDWGNSSSHTGLCFLCLFF